MEAIEALRRLKIYYVFYSHGMRKIKFTKDGICGEIKSPFDRAWFIENFEKYGYERPKDWVSAYSRTGIYTPPPEL